MGDLSQNFSEHEFACQDGFCPHCGGAGPVDSVLVDVVQEIRDELDMPLKITSGFRCPTYNRTIGSKDTSQHCRGRAADIAIPDSVDPEEFFELCEDVLNQYKAAHTGGKGGGLGKYDTFCHIDTREHGPSRWDNRT